MPLHHAKLETKDVMHVATIGYYYNIQLDEDSTLGKWSVILALTLLQDAPRESIDRRAAQQPESKEGRDLCGPAGGLFLHACGACYAVGRKIPVTAQNECEHWARLMTFALCQGW